MDNATLADLLRLAETISLTGFLLFAWWNERKERIERTNQLITWKEVDRVQLRKEEEKAEASIVASERSCGKRE